MKFSTRKIVTLSLLICISVILSIVDGMIPSFIPGIKLGLANIIILMILYSYSLNDALIVSILRVFIAGLLRGNIFNMGFFMSLSGAICSLFIMFILKKFINKIHIVGVSVVGSITHCLAQIGVGVLYLGTSVFFYLPVLLITSLITGLFIGLAAHYLNKLKLLK